MMCSERECIERMAYEQAKKATECGGPPRPGPFGPLDKEKVYGSPTGQVQSPLYASIGSPVLFQAEKEDAVTHPGYYCRGGIELRRVVEAWNLGFYLGNAIKYICRAAFKNGGSRRVEDLRKAIQNITFELEHLQQDSMAGETPGPPYNPCAHSGCSTKTEPLAYPPGS
jgi:hypothetical protein